MASFFLNIHGRNNLEGLLDAKLVHTPERQISHQHFLPFGSYKCNKTKNTSKMTFCWAWYWHPGKIQSKTCNQKLLNIDSDIKGTCFGRNFLHPCGQKLVRTDSRPHISNAPWTTLQHLVSSLQGLLIFTAVIKISLLEANWLPL